MLALEHFHLVPCNSGPARDMLTSQSTVAALKLMILRSGADATAQTEKFLRRKNYAESNFWNSVNATTLLFLSLIFLSPSLYLFLSLSLSLSLPFSLSLSLSLSQSLFLSLFHSLFISLSLSQSLSVSFSLSFFLFVFLSIFIYLILPLSISVKLPGSLILNLPFCLYISLSFSPYISISTYASICCTYSSIPSFLSLSLFSL